MKKFFTLIAAFVASSAMMAQEWEDNALKNGDLEGNDYSAWHLRPNTKDGNSNKLSDDPELYEEQDGAELDFQAGFGVDGSKGLRVISHKGAENAWQCQFWTRLPKVLEVGDKVLVSFDYRAKSQYFADMEAAGEEASLKFDTQAHTSSCSYIHWSFAGSPSTSDEEWHTFEAEVTVDGTMAGSTGVGSMAFNLSNNADYDVEWYFDNFSFQFEKPNEEEIKYWAALTSNGDFEGTDVTSYVVRIYQQGDQDVASLIEEGAGVDGSRALKVVVPAKEANDWDSQFFIKLKEPMAVDQMIQISMDIRASEDGISIDSQSHGQSAGSYNHWACVGSPSFSTEWKTYKNSVTVTSDMSKDNNPFQYIAFNLAKNDHEVTLYFDNIKVSVQKVGNIADGSPELIELKSAVESAEATYSDAGTSVPCNAAIRDAFKAAYEAALNEVETAATGEYEKLQNALIAAKSKYDASVKDYKNLATFIEWAEAKQAIAEKMGDRYADLAGQIGDIVGKLQDAQGAEEWTKDEITANTSKSDVKAIIAKEVSANVQDGDDITIMLENPDFAGSTSGWSNAGSKSLDYGPTNANNLSNDGGYLPTGMAEVWHGKFDGYQTLPSLPAGLYQITVNAAQRADLNGDDVQTEETALLYAIVNDAETHKLVMSVYADPAPEMLFDSDAESKWPSIENPNGDGWIPNGKGSGNYHLNATKADGSGYYVNTLNVLISETADMRMGIKDDNTYGWCIMDNFKVTYYSLDNKLASAAALEGLIASTEEMSDMTIPAKDALDASVETAQKVVDGIDGASLDDIKAAMEALQAAIDDANANKKAYTDADNYYYDTFSAIYEEKGEECTTAVKAKADATNAQYENMDNMTTAELNQFLADMKYLAEAMLVPGEAESATDANPYSLTEFLVEKGVDVDFEDYREIGANNNYPGWSGSGFGTGGGTAGPVGERWNQTSGFNTYVKLQGLPEGTYELSCDGAYRLGSAGSINDYNLAQATDSVDARIPYLYATTSYGTEKTNLPNVYSVLVTEEIAAEKGLDFASSDNATVTVTDAEGNSVKYLSPQQLATADQFMQAGYYLGNKVVFKVGADGEAQIGVRLEKGASNDWTFVDNFTLVYYGANSAIVPTAIEGVQTVAAKAIYTITGVRVNNAAKAGLYIINGKKVLVK